MLGRAQEQRTNSLPTELGKAGLIARVEAPWGVGKYE
jgi:hypothetical protein